MLSCCQHYLVFKTRYITQKQLFIVNKIYPPWNSKFKAYSWVSWNRVPLYIYIPSCSGTHSDLDWPQIQRSAYLWLPSTGIKDLHHHDWFIILLRSFIGRLGNIYRSEDNLQQFSLCGFQGSNSHGQAHQESIFTCWTILLAPSF